ncbi:MAG: hypothetical protein JWQ87_1636 [Candidatus Sulfotelmatobacter sp.]|nr:hypothetical protein [Candidatus Sulfotelmatobacter sp.]
MVLWSLREVSGGRASPGRTAEAASLRVFSLGHVNYDAFGAYD